MKHPKTIQNVVLDGHSLTLEDLVAVARFGAKVELSDQAREALARSKPWRRRSRRRSGWPTASPPASAISPLWRCRRS